MNGEGTKFVPVGKNRLFLDSSVAKLDVGRNKFWMEYYGTTERGLRSTI